MKTRRHHNNKGYRQCKDGKCEQAIKKIAKVLGIPYGAPMHPDYNKVTTARNGVHYQLERGLYFTLLGLETLNMEQRRMISTAFHYGKLGNEYTFPDPEQIWEFDPEAVDEVDEVEAGEVDQRMIEQMADRAHDQGRDDAAMGIDSVYARMYKRGRGRE